MVRWDPLAIYVTIAIYEYLGPKSHPNAHQRQSIAIAMWNARGLGPTCLTDPFPVLSGWNHYLFSISYTQRLLINLLSTRPPNTTILDFSIFTAAWSFRGWGRVPRKIKGRCSNPIMHFCSYSPALSLPSFSVISLSTFCRLFFFQTSLKTLPLDSCSLSLFLLLLRLPTRLPFPTAPLLCFSLNPLLGFPSFSVPFSKTSFLPLLTLFFFSSNLNSLSSCFSPLQIWILSLKTFLTSSRLPWPFDFLSSLLKFPTLLHFP